MVQFLKGGKYYRLIKKAKKTGFLYTTVKNKHIELQGTTSFLSGQCLAKED